MKLLNPKNLKLLYVYIVIFVFVFILYSNSINNEYSIDDNLVVEGVEKVEKGIEGLPLIFSTRYISNKNQNYGYRPMVLSSFALEKTFFKKLPKSQSSEEKKVNDQLTQANISHLINVLIYAISCLLLFYFLHSIFRTKNIFLPIFISLLFIAHPIHTEVVSNIKCRDELLMFLNTLISLICFIKFTENNEVKYLFSGLLFFMVAVLSKKSALAILGILPILLYYSKVSTRKFFICTLSLILSSVLLFIFKKNMISIDVVNRAFQHYENPLFTKVDIVEKIKVSLYCSWHYLTLLIFPKNLASYYGFDTIPTTSWASYKLIGATLFYGLFGFFGVKYWLKRNVLGLGIAIWFGVMLAFVNLFIPMVGIVADRFAYVFSLGFCIVLAALLMKIFKIDINKNDSVPIAFILTLVLILISYSARVIIRNSDWENRTTLFQHDVNVVPNSAKAHSLLAGHLYDSYQKNNIEYLKENIKDDIIFHFKKAIEIDSTFITSYNNLGSAYLSLYNDASKGLQYFLKATELDPQYYEAHLNLAIAYEKLENFDMALAEYIKIIDLFPTTINSFYLFNNFLKRNPHLNEDGINALVETAKTNISPKMIYLNLANFYKKDSSNEELFIFFLERAFAADTSDKSICKSLYQYFFLKNNSEKISYYQRFK
ncbi:MAG: hypothetical protein P1U56_00010 [Saprospiraceae bacterium]|nr:hypothetical protein [Saprospiraceae bacterium]